MSRVLKLEFRWWLEHAVRKHISFDNADITLCGRNMRAPGLLDWTEGDWKAITEIEFESGHDRCDNCLAMKRSADKAADGCR